MSRKKARAHLAKKDAESNALADDYRQAAEGLAGFLGMSQEGFASVLQSNHGGDVYKWAAAHRQSDVLEGRRQALTERRHKAARVADLGVPTAE